MATRLRPHFQDLAQQTHAARLGMWIFIGSEALLFAALFALYAAYRVAYPEAFRAAAGYTDLPLGTAMTVVLITSSFAVAAATAALRDDESRAAVRGLGVAVALAFAFLGLKAIEYTLHFRDGIFPGPAYRFEALPAAGANVFFNLYYVMTGLHALHVLSGIAILGWLARAVRGGRLDGVYHTPLELGGMYWHFVDIVWVFLWPLFYLLR